jgi:exopolysaccharide biosynthesis protein
MRWLVLFFALVWGARARADLTPTVTNPYPGVTHAVYSDPSVPLVLHLMTIDASSQEIHLYATQATERGQTLSDFAKCAKGVAGCISSQVAIGGDLFTPLGFVPDGLAMGNNTLWPDANMDNAVEGFFAFGRPGDVNALYVSDPSTVEMPPSKLAAVGVVGGRAMLVSAGQPQASYDAMDPTEPFRSAPRAAVGIDQNGRTLWLAVVDGDQQSSIGMTAEELADFLAGLGVYDAIQLDGGGAAELFVKNEGGVVSSPSDGVERLLANHLGVHYGLSQYRFSLVGLVYDSVFGDMSKLITTANVVVDGQTATWQNSHTLYHCDNIAPHYVCAHATAPGYKSATQCRQITESDVAPPNGQAVQYLSLVMFPGTDPPPDMATPPDLATARHDLAEPQDFAAPSGADGGMGNVAGGGCQIGGEPASLSSLVLLVVLLIGAARKRLRV